MSSVLHWEPEELDRQLENGGVVLVDFYADWCMPCKMMAPVVDKAADTFDGRVTVGKVNVDEQPELAARYGIQSIPALILFKDGEPVDELIGARPYEELATALEAVL